jgi:excisionase family DNA binding protein
MTRMPGTLLTIDEVAECLRVHRNTVYRWCRTGRLHAVKLGKEWRILEDELEGALRRSSTQPVAVGARTGDSELDQLLGHDAHLVGLVGDAGEVFDLELAYLSAGLTLNRKLLKACWWQSAPEVRAHLVTGGLDVEALEYAGRLEIHDLAGVFRSGGFTAAANVWLRSYGDAVAEGYDGVWGAGSPHLECCGTHDDLLAFERTLDAGLAGRPVMALCTYSLDTAVPGLLGRIVDVISHHTAVYLAGDGRTTALAAFGTTDSRGKPGMAGREPNPRGFHPASARAQKRPD